MLIYNTISQFFFVEAKMYDYSKNVALAYGIFGLGNFPSDFVITYTYYFYDFPEITIEDNKNAIEQIRAIINDTLWIENSFNILEPTFSTAWGLLNIETKTIYTEIINYTENCINNFNYNDENAYLQELKANDDDYYFAYEENNPYRKVDAFIFRRIDNNQTSTGNWSVAWMKKMLKKIKQITSE